MKPLVIIAIRSNINWLEMTKNKFFAQTIFKPEWLSNHWKYIQFWNKFMKIDYFTVRHQLQKLSENSIKNIKNIDLVIKGKENIFNFVNKNNKWIILPTDDDDFYNPIIVNKILDMEDDVIHWETIEFNTSKIYKFNKDKIIPSNGYALSCKIAKKINKDDLQVMISRHCVVRGKVDRFGLECKKIKACLALYNRSPLSFSYTREKEWKGKEMEAYFSSLNKQLKQNVSCPFPWAVPYIDGVRNILSECF